MEYAVKATNVPEDDFLGAYLEAAEWAGLQEEDVEALELAVSPKWDAASIERARADCEDFCKANAALLEGYDLCQAGHDFYLSRNGHGAGFFDRAHPNADALQRAAEVYGSTYETLDADSARLDAGRVSA